MIILAAAKITLDFYGNDHIEKKMSEIKKLIKQVTQKFAVDVQEVDAFEDPEKCVLAMVLTDSDERRLKKRLDGICAFVDKISFARVVSDDREYFRYE